MHLYLILLAVGASCLARLILFRPSQSIRWQYMLGLFLFPPLLLLVTTIAILNMGQGHMLGLPVGQIGQVCAAGLLVTAGLILIWRVFQGSRSLRQVQQYPTLRLEALGEPVLAQVLPEAAIPFAAQIGFWQPQLVITQGLLRQLTAWMPNTERLWQELLLLREMRADRWAANRVDPLLLAESLLQMAQAPLLNLENACAASASRLEERIEALLSEAETGQSADTARLPWLWVLLAFMPLLTTLAHH
jgi:hypothetical protein